MRRWTKIRTIDTSCRAGMKLIEMLEKKFPEVKFKLGKIVFHSSGLAGWPFLSIPIMAYLPTPHPNEESKEGR